MSLLPRPQLHGPRALRRAGSCARVIVLLLLPLLLVHSQLPSPQRPLQLPAPLSGSLTPSIAVNDSASLISALADATYGEIVLNAGQSYFIQQNQVLVVANRAGTMVVRSSASANFVSGVRMLPGDPSLARIVSNTSNPLLQASSSGNLILWLVGIEFVGSPGLTVSSFLYVTQLQQLGVDHCYLHGSAGSYFSLAPVYVTSSALALVDTYISNITGAASNVPAIIVLTINTQPSGPLLIQNCFVSAAQGWLQTYITAYPAPQDASFIGNYFTRDLNDPPAQPADAGFVLGVASRWLFRNNVMENVLMSAANAPGAVFKLFLTVSEDNLLFESNIIRNACSLAFIQCGPAAGGMLFQNNFIYNINAHHCVGPSSTAGRYFGNVLTFFVPSNATCPIASSLGIGLFHNHAFFSGSLVLIDTPLLSSNLLNLTISSNVLSAPPASSDQAAGGAGILWATSVPVSDAGLLSSITGSFYFQNNLLLGLPAYPPLGGPNGFLSAPLSNTSTRLSADVTLWAGGNGQVDALSWDDPCAGNLAYCALSSSAAGVLVGTDGVTVGANISYLLNSIVGAQAQPSPPLSSAPGPSSTPPGTLPPSGTTATNLPPPPVTASFPSGSIPPTVLPSQNNTSILVLPAGPVYVNGTFQQSPTGTLVVSLTTVSLSSTQPLVTVLSCAMLSGTLQISLGYPVTTTQQLAVLQSPCLQGAFDNVSLTGAGSSCTRIGGQTSQNGVLSVLLQTSCSSGSPVGAIVGITLAILVLVAVAALLALWWYKKVRPYSTAFNRSGDKPSDVITPAGAPGLLYKVMPPNTAGSSFHSQNGHSERELF